MTFCINDCKVIMVFKRRRLRMMNDIARFHQSKSALCPPFITCPRVILMSTFRSTYQKLMALHRYYCYLINLK